MGTSQTANHKQGWMNARINHAKIEGLSLNEEKLIATFCIEHCSTRKTALEIIKNLENAGHIKRHEGDIMSPELYNEIQRQGARGQLPPNKTNAE